MNIANKLTILRMILVPFFIFFFITDMVEQPMGRYIALGIFIIASLTDFLDGYLARSRNMVTTFGKFMDPLADKLLVVSALVSLTFLGELSPWVVMIIIAREFIISGFRLVAASEGIVIAASWWGKIKTATQMFMIILLLFNIDNPTVNLIEVVLIWAAVILTIVSLVDYLVKNKHVLTFK
ncbi:CDP-diacylglycerol--glycerol-3-phosphate 3-phosphatidyltransferase [Vallitalea okinawensis]|uniref:CDP-diacylglycerol--glycerol-3-phosphate 3-phosphatidyltransferase n=1 Tax=Vallitalea okinawensis TaxID=2078660 RepID=UPI000CFB6E90|nr:CDP-diacylglycerol--glycerol-3-phosphate 3-phosphatidyltransferase [Vallitalea okinawensis]